MPNVKYHSRTNNIHGWTSYFDDNLWTHMKGDDFLGPFPDRNRVSLLEDGLQRLDSRLGEEVVPEETFLCRFEGRNENVWLQNNNGAIRLIARRDFDEITAVKVINDLDNFKHFVRELKEDGERKILANRPQPQVQPQEARAPTPDPPQAPPAQAPEPVQGAAESLCKIVVAALTVMEQFKQSIKSTFDITCLPVMFFCKCSLPWSLAHKCLLAISLCKCSLPWSLAHKCLLAISLCKCSLPWSLAHKCLLAISLCKCSLPWSLAHKCLLAISLCECSLPWSLAHKCLLAISLCECSLPWSLAHKCLLAISLCECSLPWSLAHKCLLAISLCKCSLPWSLAHKCLLAISLCKCSLPWSLVHKPPHALSLFMASQAPVEETKPKVEMSNWLSKRKSESSDNDDETASSTGDRKKRRKVPANFVQAVKLDDTDSEPEAVLPPTQYTLGKPHRLSKHRDNFARLYCKEDRTLLSVGTLVMKNGVLRKEKYGPMVSLEPSEFQCLLGLGETLAEEAVIVRKAERKRSKQADMLKRGSKYYNR